MSKSMEARMREAGVPKSCWSFSISASGYAWVNDWADSLRENMDGRTAKMGAYVHHGANAAPEAVQVVELLARQAVVRGVPTKHTPYHQIVRALKSGEFDSYDREGDDGRRPTSVCDVFGAGVIAVPNLPASGAIDCNQEQYDSVMDYLTSHIYEGGVLVFCGRPVLTGTMRGKWPALFERTAFQNCQVFEV